ncbi:uncharacterized protein LOC111324208 [Stylophora pistillata]|uniref:TET-Associated Glycosyltransferase domain-containing protein n=1 Tax=Stylophora pistillata TaxID=50429 RepID=A0A2B4SKN2_STYPI|nr:uncharacterized protein LOC111324208 [Stylophora pistillata]PFX29926.1 hypothetical protein AWC38_SpisGene5291 [Stylophora pistillata]
MAEKQWREPKAKRELFDKREGESLGKSCSSESEPHEQEYQTSDSRLDEEVSQEVASLTIADENRDGKWLSNHPWEAETPNIVLKMKATVSNSASYPTSDEWTTPSKKVDLTKIYDNLPKFIESEMKGTINSCREELTQVVTNILENREPLNLPLSPHTCGQTSWIQKIRFNNFKGKRWIFVPSFRRAQIALLDWPEDALLNKESTITVLVVRPSEFDEYVRHCGHENIVIRLPQDEIGAGYPRYWIQKIALRLQLDFIWMMDDSVECFYEYHPTVVPPLKFKGGSDYSEYRRRQFGLVFERIENFVKADSTEHAIAAMSPRRWYPQCKPKKPFSCKPPHGVVFLNLRVLQAKNIFYRPELKTLEDILFGYECERKGLKVFRDNRVMLYDHNWKNTGASSPSVKNK